MLLGIAAAVVTIVLSALAGGALFFVAGVQALRERKRLKAGFFLIIGAVLGVPSAIWLAGLGLSTAIAVVRHGGWNA